MVNKARRLMSIIMNGSGNVPMKRVKYVSMFLDPPEAAEDWNYSQSSMDEDMVRWNVKPGLDGSMNGLYIQVPYGYVDDLLRRDKSVVLSFISKSMRAKGHPDWADVVDEDVISDANWASGSCQTIAFSYTDEYRIDEDYMEALSSFDPYKIAVINSDLMTEYAEDEAPNGKSDADRAKSTGRAALILALVAGVLTIASPQLAWLFLVPAGAAGAGVVSLVMGHLKKRKWDQEILKRPGYLLEIPSGWLVWQYDEGNATPAKLAQSAMSVVGEYVDRSYADVDLKDRPSMGTTSVSSDGRMVFIKSDKTLPTDCKMTPYEAEKYLSLYVAHQHHPLQARSYGKQGPTIIKRTVGMELPGSSMSSVDSEWTSESALRRASEGPSTAELKALVHSKLRSLVDLSNSTVDGLGSEDSSGLEDLGNVNKIIVQLQDADLDGLDDATLKAMADSIDNLTVQFNDTVSRLKSNASMKTAEESVKVINPFIDGS